VNGQAALPLESKLLPLLRATTAATTGFAIWKNAQAGLTGRGDLDAVAPADDWAQIAAEHRRWTLANELGPPLSCHHVPGLLLLVAFTPDRNGKLLQLDVSSHIFIGGAPAVPATRLASLLVMDARGFRMLRPGAEGLFKLLQLAAGPGKPHPPTEVDAQLTELLASDPVGVERAVQLLGRAQPAARRAARTAVAGRWDRRAMTEVSGWCLLKALRRPLLPARRVRSGLGPARRCPLIAALAGGRCVPDAEPEWVARVAAAHAPNHVLGRPDLGLCS
jgi:hypothetical protein